MWTINATMLFSELIELAYGGVTKRMARYTVHIIGKILKYFAVHLIDDIWTVKNHNFWSYQNQSANAVPKTGYISNVIAEH